MRVELIQFLYSHYNEKARWALDWKRVPHRRTNLLPGPHARTVTRLTGQTEVPVVCFDGRAVHGSARIIDELERRYPRPSLYPADPAERERALAIQRRFDDEVGPAVRRALFSVMIDEPGYACAMFAESHGAPMRLAYRAAFPLARGRIRRSVQLDDPAAVEDAFRVTSEALDWVAEQGVAGRQLVGTAFSVADLAVAALLAPIANPPDSPMMRPEPAPAPVAAFAERYAAHPAVAWVHAQYRRHRSRAR